MSTADTALSNMNKFFINHVFLKKKNLGKYFRMGEEMTTTKPQVQENR